MYLHTYVHHSITHNSHDVEKPKCPAMDEWIYKMWSINKMKYYTSFKKEESLIMRYHMHKPQGHYSKLNKLVTKGQTLYDSTHRKYPKVKIKETDSRKECAKDWKRGKGN